MATNQDILAFLMAEKEARAKEKEEERATRMKERTEDMEQIKDLIKSGVKEEVNAAIEPIKKELKMQVMETNELRQETIELKTKFEEVLKEVEVLKESSKCEQFPKLPAAGNLSNLFRAGTNFKTNQTRGTLAKIKFLPRNHKIILSSYLFFTQIHTFFIPNFVRFWKKSYLNS